MNEIQVKKQMYIAFFSGRKANVRNFPFPLPSYVAVHHLLAALM